jgi:hypothetical protein
MKKLIALGLSLLVILGAAGCSSSTQSESAPGFDGAVDSGTSSGGGPSRDDENGLAVGDRQVVMTAFAELAADNPAEAAEGLVSLVERNQGRVEQKSLYKDIATVPVSAYLVLRVPSGNLNPVLDALEDFGSVQLLEVGSSDVTATVIDLDARVVALETSVARLLDLIENSRNTSDLIEIEYALTQRQSELDALKSSLAYYRDSVSYATVSVNIYSVDIARQSPPANIWQGLVVGWQSLIGFLGNSLIAIGIALPWLIFLGAPLAAVAWLALRARRIKLAEQHEAKK